jgi:hypothetical protein
MKVSINEECFLGLHYNIKSELGIITEELLDNLKDYNCSSKLSSDDVAKQIGLVYRHLRCAIFNGLYETAGAYPIYVDESYDDDKLTITSKYHKKFVEIRQRWDDELCFSKIKVDDSKFDSYGIRFYKRATKNLFDLTNIFDNPTSRMSEDDITKSWTNRFLATQNTHELDEVVNIYCKTEWMKSEKLEKLLLRTYSAFNIAKLHQASTYTDELFMLTGKVIYEILFLIGNVFLSKFLCDGKSEFIPLIFVAIYFLKFYNPISVFIRRRSFLDDDNHKYLSKSHNKIMSDDYFYPSLIKEEFQELERKGLNVSRYVFKLLNTSTNF